MTTIANTTVISNFAAINQLEVLRVLYGSLYISTEVYEEIQAGLSEGYAFYEGLSGLVQPFVSNGWILLTGMAGNEEFEVFSRLPRHLHAGEASCLAIAATRRWLFLTDDKAARSTGLRLDIKISGSVGCLVLAKERQICSLEQANAWLAAMIELGYKAPVTDLTPLIKPR